MSIRARVQGVFARGRGWLLADQLASSAGNALPLIISSLRLNDSELPALSLVLVVATTALALHRSLLLDPTLSVIGGAAFRWHGIAVGALSSLLAGLVGTLVCGLTGLATDLVSVLIVLGVVSTVCFQDFMRYRSLHAGRVTRTFLADALWMLTAVIGVVLVPPSWTLVVLVWGFAALLSVTLLAFPSPGQRRDHLLRETLSRGRFQFSESLVVSVLTVVPLFVGAALGWDARIAAIRLAQSGFGPLNAIHSTMTLAIMTRSQELQSRDSAAVRRLHFRAQKLIAISALGYAVIAGVALFMLPVDGAEVADQLAISIVVVGAATVITSISSPTIVLLRAFGFHRKVLEARMLVIACAAVCAVALVLLAPSVIDPASAMIVSAAVIGLVVWQLLRKKLI